MYYNSFPFVEYILMFKTFRNLKFSLVVWGITMNEEIFNMQLRKFLKNVGITSQRKIEEAVRAALESGQISEKNCLTANVSLSIPELSLNANITGEIKLV